VRLFKRVCLINWNIFGWQVSSCFSSKLFTVESYTTPTSNAVIAKTIKYGVISSDVHVINSYANSIRGNLDNAPGGSIDATGLLHTSITGVDVPPRSFWQYFISSLSGFYANQIGNTAAWETRVNKPDQCFIPTYSSIGIKIQIRVGYSPLA